MITRQAAWAALAQVRDPELDEPITDLGFVRKLRVDGGAVHAQLRLPTYFCAPNFVFMMVADADEALRALPGAAEVRVELDDHFTGGEISEGVGRGFEATFPGLADGDLADLRSVFRRKAFIAAQARLCRDLLAQGWTPADLTGLRLGDLPPSPLAADYERARAAVGQPVDPDAWLLTQPDGSRVPAERVDRHLRFGNALRVSVEGNAEHCRALLAARYSDDLGGAA
ncbi:metal-sulfur cluster assembly factor [Acrocarpospora catenulata]|uniref:metal-sulfur cluster assembly factor n=1 Tax=Acrocarpospora catenulata TaxID=2836182 RepID=UPI001BDA2DC0|nr:iron-sulfur cluster assembly protein [Acrocarpospora catenulata]